MDVLNSTQRKPVHIACSESTALASCHAALAELIVCPTYRPIVTRSVVVNETNATTWNPADRIGCLMPGTQQ